MMKSRHYTLPSILVFSLICGIVLSLSTTAMAQPTKTSSGLEWSRLISTQQAAEFQGHHYFLQQGRLLRYVSGGIDQPMGGYVGTTSAVFTFKNRLFILSEGGSLAFLMDTRWVLAKSSIRHAAVTQHGLYVISHDDKLFFSPDNGVPIQIYGYYNRSEYQGVGRRWKDIPTPNYAESLLFYDTEVNDSEKFARETSSDGLVTLQVVRKEGAIRRLEVSPKTPSKP